MGLPYKSVHQRIVATARIDAITTSFGALKEKFISIKTPPFLFQQEFLKKEIHTEFTGKPGELLKEGLK